MSSAALDLFSSSAVTSSMRLRHMPLNRSVARFHMLMFINFKLLACRRGIFEVFFCPRSPMFCSCFTPRYDMKSGVLVQSTVPRKYSDIQRCPVRTSLFASFLAAACSPIAGSLTSSIPNYRLTANIFPTTSCRASKPRTLLCFAL